MNAVHIIGGGLAGLAAAVELAPQVPVIVYEGASSCGGRARSFEDERLGARIDNGSHLILRANEYLFRFLNLTGGVRELVTPGRPVFSFYDFPTRKNWELHLSSGRIPWWVFMNSRRPPGMKLRDLLCLREVLSASAGESLRDILGRGGALGRLLLEPAAVSALNTPPEEADVCLFANVLRESLLKSGAQCQPFYAKTGLSETFVDPALAFIRRFHGEIRQKVRVREITRENGRVVALETSGGRVDLERGDQVILATPLQITKILLPEIRGPSAYESILNYHFRVPGFSRKADGFTGASGGIVEWVFWRDDVLSVTISAANRYFRVPPEELKQRVWRELRQLMRHVYGEMSLPEEAPPDRVVWEKRATFAATEEQNSRRSGTRTPYLNLVLAGDWVATGLPATLEGAVRSGLAAAGALGYRSPLKAFHRSRGQKGFLAVDV